MGFAIPSVNPNMLCLYHHTDAASTISYSFFFWYIFYVYTFYIPYCHHPRCRNTITRNSPNPHTAQTQILCWKVIETLYRENLFGKKVEVEMVGIGDGGGYMFVIPPPPSPMNECISTS